MQTIQVICMGKCGATHFEQAAKEYEKRLQAYCKIQVIEIAEETVYEKNASAAVITKALEKEATAILGAIKNNAHIVAMCIEGKMMASTDLADYIQEKACTGQGDIAFIIGSSHGLADTIKQKANYKLSMSKMTFPHGMARVMILEQIYRAFSILAKSKYHK